VPLFILPSSIRFTGHIIDAVPGIPSIKRSIAENMPEIVWSVEIVGRQCRIDHDLLPGISIIPESGFS